MSDEFEREEKDFDPTDLKKGAIFDIDPDEAVDDPLLDPSLPLVDEEIDQEEVVDEYELYEADTDDTSTNESYSY